MSRIICDSISKLILINRSLYQNVPINSVPVPTVPSIEPHHNPPRKHNMPSRFIQANSLCVDEVGHNPLIDLLNTDGELYVKFSDIKELNSIITAIIHKLIRTAIKPIPFHWTSAKLKIPDRIRPLTILMKRIRSQFESAYWGYFLGGMYEELESLKEKGVYVEVESIPLGRKALGSKWVLHIKLLKLFK
jgi:hypothetical protein